MMRLMTDEAGIEVPIRDEAIRLGQLLKLAGVVDDGVQARAVIQAGDVRVDGDVETRRARQVARGSVVELPGVVLQVTGE